ncbi:MAG: oligosaccharide flippase family protein [Clostridia bacterium]|nr:oligosaccharide flippase family protein [Clostridia bacterium]
MVFNHEARKENVLKASVSALINCAVNIGLQLGYRTVFLHVLTYEYLGMDRLFADILGLLGLADLGVAEAIIFRLYDPISREDTERVGRLMRFFGRTYHFIALVILMLGSIVCPLLGLLIQDTSEIPKDTNIYLVFMLLLFQSASTYLFSYRLFLLSADQKQNQTNILNTINVFARYTVQMLLLIVTQSYAITLVSGVVVTLLCNWLAGIWAEKQYPQVFRSESDLSKKERGQIYHDMSATFLHKVGGTIVVSTDSILLSRFAGLTVTGVYSNYQMVISGITGLIAASLGALMPSFGNAHVTMKEAERYSVFKKTLFLNFWIAGMTTCCLYNLINDFILLWVRKELFLDEQTVLLLCALFYMQTVRRVSIIYTMSCGLINRDRFRPIVESVLNIFVSILCLKTIGTAGIFLGTIVSNLATVFWREPYLLYRYAFRQKLSDYWKLYTVNLIVTVCAVCLSARLKGMLFEDLLNVADWVICGFLCAFIFQIVHGLVFFRTEGYRYYIGLLSQRIRRMFR